MKFPAAGKAAIAVPASQIHSDASVDSEAPVTLSKMAAGIRDFSRFLRASTQFGLRLRGAL